MTTEPENRWLLVERSVSDRHAAYRSRLASVGRKLPHRQLSTEALMASTRHRTGIDLERLTGIHERRVAGDADDSYSLASAAARDCLARSNVAATDLDVVLSCSITKFDRNLVQHLEPPMSLMLARDLGAPRAITFDVSNACAGMLTGVFILNNWIRRGVVSRGLVVSGEYISPLGRNAAEHIRSIVSHELASLTLGDAGAALLLERAPSGCEGISLAGFTTIAEHSRLCLAYPASDEPGARMFTRSQALQRAAIADTPLLLGGLLKQEGLQLSELDHVIPHQTSVRAIRKGMQHVTEELGCEPRNPAVVTVDRYGNTASTSHSVALVEELQAGRVRPGDRVAMVALASGLVIGVVLFTADEGLVGAYGHQA